MKVIVFALRRPDMNHWTCEGHATNDEQLVLITARLRADPEVQNWHVCQDLDYDIDGCQP